jgi:hypothetical protein
MYYAPHILQLKTGAVYRDDEFGRPVTVLDSDEWTTVCRCRCDEDGETLLTDDNGRRRKAEWHIVLEGNRDDERVRELRVGSVIRCTDLKGNERCRGYIPKIDILNYLPYGEIWL